MLSAKIVTIAEFGVGSERKVDIVPFHFAPLINGVSHAYVLAGRKSGSPLSPDSFSAPASVLGSGPRVRAICSRLDRVERI